MKTAAYDPAFSKKADIAQNHAKEFVAADRAKASARLKSGRHRPKT